MESSNFLAFIILVSGLIGIILIKAVGKFLKSQAKKTESLIDDIIIASFGKPLMLFLLIITIYSFLAASTFIPVEYVWILDSKYLMVCITILVTWIFWSFVKNVVMQYEELIL